ncbi:hypothetical protein KRX51_03595 [Corynebacterium sp. TAE3-ERU12]|nr:hypothetical protein [Corynebacterium sp. TAE3-ERU12]MBV7295001.1 hypothetical protein [Corynebacterium sp. TAE3-ERU12]
MNFLVDPLTFLQEKERKAFIEAGELIGRLHDALEQQYINPESEESQHALNVLCVRFVVCLFAEDAGLSPPMPSAGIAGAFSSRALT